MGLCKLRQIAAPLTWLASIMDVLSTEGVANHKYLKRPQKQEAEEKTKREGKESWKKAWVRWSYELERGEGDY